MAVFVTDASLVASLYVEDPLTEKATAAFGEMNRRGASLHAPDLFLIEMANVLWKRTKRSELSIRDAMRAIDDLIKGPIKLHASDQFIPQALALAIAHDLTVYDASYVAVAIIVGGLVVSGDKRFCERGALGGLPVIDVTDV